MKIVVRAFGHAAAALGTTELSLEASALTVNELLAKLNDSIGGRGAHLSKETFLIAIDGIEISAIDGGDTQIQEPSTISLIPVSHGG